MSTRRARGRPSRSLSPRRATRFQSSMWLTPHMRAISALARMTARFRFRTTRPTVRHHPLEYRRSSQFQALVRRIQTTGSPGPVDGVEIPCPEACRVRSVKLRARGAPRSRASAGTIRSASPGQVARAPAQAQRGAGAGRVGHGACAPGSELLGPPEFAQHGAELASRFRSASRPRAPHEPVPERFTSRCTRRADATRHPAGPSAFGA